MNKIIEDEIQILYEQLKDSKYHINIIDTDNIKTLIIHYFSNSEIKDKVNLVIQTYEDKDIIQVNCYVEIDGSHYHPEVYRIENNEINFNKIRNLFNNVRNYLDSL